MGAEKGAWQKMNEYISVAQYAERHGLDGGWVRRMIGEGRIAAVKIGNQWAILADEPKPDDKRVKSGKYKDWRSKDASNR